MGLSVVQAACPAVKQYDRCEVILVSKYCAAALVVRHFLIWWKFEKLNFFTFAIILICFFDLRLKSGFTPRAPGGLVGRLGTKELYKHPLRGAQQALAQVVIQIR